MKYLLLVYLISFSSTVGAQISIAIDTFSIHEYNASMYMVTFDVVNLTNDELYLKSSQIDKISGFLSVTNSDSDKAHTIYFQNGSLKLSIEGFTSPLLNYFKINEIAKYEKSHLGNNVKHKITYHDSAYYLLKPNSSIKLYSILSTNNYVFAPTGKLSKKQTDEISATLIIGAFIYNKSKGKFDYQKVHSKMPEAFKLVILKRLE